MIEQKEKLLCGLDESEVEESAKAHGRNVMSTSKKRSLAAHFLSNLSDPVIKILLFALVINLFFVFRGKEIYESVGISLSVFLATFISTLSERGSEAAFKRLSEQYMSVTCKARRGGKLKEIPISDVVVGDVVLLSAGDGIPADGIIRSGRLTVDQSSLTGESREIEKSASVSHILSPTEKLSPDSSDVVFRGCNVLSGQAEIEILAVGDATLIGEISREVQMDTRDSPLKLRLSRLAKQISILGYVAAILVGVATLFNTFIIDSGFVGEVILMKLRDLPYLFEQLLHAFMLSLTVLVMAVPEGLPMMIAVVLSSNIKRMLKGGVLVRKAVGIEAAGSMNILFTDKTGTLTEGKMSVSSLICADLSEFSSLSYMKKRAPSPAHYYSLSASYDTSCVPSSKKALGGNATERALMNFLLSSKNTVSEYRIIHRNEFDSARKFSSATLLKGGVKLTLIKGAPEKLLPHISHAYASDGGRHIPFAPLSYEFSRKISSLASCGKRILLIATSEEETRGDHIPDGLCLVCAAVLEDKIRPQAKRSVRALRSAGIQVVMLTGDNKETATSIGKECGIINSKTSIVLSGEELERMSDGDIAKILPRIGVISRVLPTDKSRLVKIAQELSLVVGMTGDGINDAPALRRADIGFSMGSGTQVAKDAGDIIILDDDLSSVCRAVLYGRTIFKSIRKFITLQLTMNFSAVGISMICPFIGFDAPVTVTQMLWINLIMDTLGGLAFASEAPMEHYMKEKPKRRDEPILCAYMVTQIAFLSLYSLGLCLAFLRLPAITSHYRASPDNIYLLTAFFALFIFSSVLNCFSCRTDRLRLFKGLSQNRVFIVIMLAIVVIQILFTYLGGSILRTAPLLYGELIFTIVPALTVIPADILRKLILRLLGKKQGF